VRGCRGHTDRGSSMELLGQCAQVRLLLHWPTTPSHFVSPTPLPPPYLFSYSSIAMGLLIV
jgi:hypothetical protein